MYVKKFEADSLDEALQNIKKELGPDAIILKTKSHKGLAGKFKKNRIEITAAISEKNYVDKSKVDRVLSNEQKDQFYRSNAEQVNRQIKNYSQHNSPQQAEGQSPAASSTSGYGGMALNKVVKRASDLVKSGLDDFLGEKESSKPMNLSNTSGVRNPRWQEKNNSAEDNIENDHQKRKNPKSNNFDQIEIEQDNRTEKHYDNYEEQERKLQSLEEKVASLAQLLDQQSDQLFLEKGNQQKGFAELRSSLRSLDIREPLVQEILKKASFELSQEDQNDEDAVFDLALRELGEALHVDLAMFSKNHTNQGVITVFLSDAAAGQTSSWYKIGALKKGSLLVHYGHPETEIKSLTGQMFNLDIHQVNSLSEIVSSCRKAVDEKRDVFVDFRNKNTDIDETKNFIEGLKRGFSQVEVLVCLSAIHSELYNRKVLKKFGRLTNGMVVNHLDLCLNFGMIINLSSEFAHLPYKFFGTGAVVPDDIESATKERILGGLFNL